VIDAMISRTRIKMCGLTRTEDIQAVVSVGVDAIGFVFYPPSPRYVTPDMAVTLLAVVPPFVTTVGLFVNATLAQVQQVLTQVPVAVLQFHGDETPEQCHAIASAVNKPFIRAIRVSPVMTGADLLKYDYAYRVASGALFAGLLLDTFVDGYGGGGKVFDWSIIPEELASRVVLSGGLNVPNVIAAVIQVRPYAVDVSSGIEEAKGIKDAVKIRAFVDAIHLADCTAKPASNKQNREKS
jgi:phosphoribosylanthranilate isomerase